MTTIATATYTEKDEAISMFSDQYKCAYGVRPRNYNWEAWTLEEIYAEMDSIQVVIEADMKAEEIAQRASVVEFNELVEKTISLGAGDRKTALRWLYDGSGIGEITSMFDLESFIYQIGIMHTKEGDAVIQELISIYNN